MVKQDTSGTTITGYIASTTMVSAGTAGGTANIPKVEDASYSALDVNENTVTSSDLTFSSSSAVLSGLSATVGDSIVVSDTTIGKGVTFAFTLTAGNNTLYISADPNIALSTSSSGFGDSASTTVPQTGVIANPGTISGDTNITLTGGYYVIPAGSSRSFTYNGSMINRNGTTGNKTYSITAVRYGTASSALTANSINYNITALKISTLL